MKKFIRSIQDKPEIILDKMHIDQVLVQSLSIHQYLNSIFQFEVDLDHLNIHQWSRPRRLARLLNVHPLEVSVNLSWSRTVINFRSHHRTMVTSMLVTMLETKCVVDNYKMFETNIGIQSSTPTNRHQHHCDLERDGRIATVKLKIPEKAFLKSESRTWKNFLYFSQFFHGSILAKSQPLPLVDSFSFRSKTITWM